MSNSRSTSTANKKLDEKNLKTLRELAALIFNKQCFDCHQRGPTYVNMTIGSFVCTSCSGRLRGLNPPHRVKSISMATFTHDEIEFIKSRGNEYCRKVWMGRHDKSRTMDETTFKDETQMKDFLTLKYEKKRWYVSPSEIPAQDLSVQHTGGSTGSAGSAGLTHNAAAGTAPHATNNNFGSVPNSFSSPTPTQKQHATPTSPPNAVKQNNLVNFMDDPFGGAAPPPTQSATNGSSGFANFASFDAFAAAPTPAAHQQHQMHQPPSVQHQTRPIDPSSSAMQKSATVPAMPAAAAAVSPGDKYSALKELDEMFSQPTTQPAAPTTTAPPSWMPPPSNQQSTGGFGGGLSTASGHNFGAASHLAAKPSGAMSSSVSAFNFGGVSGAFAGGNPFFSQSAAAPAWNQQQQAAPAGGGMNHPQLSANPFFAGQTQQVANPFGGASQVPPFGYQQHPAHQQQQMQMGQPNNQWPVTGQAVPAGANPFAGGQQMPAGWNPFFK